MSHVWISLSLHLIHSLFLTRRFFFLQYHGFSGADCEEQAIPAKWDCHSCTSPAGQRWAGCWPGLRPVMVIIHHLVGMDCFQRSWGQSERFNECRIILSATSALREVKKCSALTQHLTRMHTLTNDNCVCSSLSSLLFAPWGQTESIRWRSHRVSGFA